MHCFRDILGKAVPVWGIVQPMNDDCPPQKTQKVGWGEGFVSNWIVMCYHSGTANIFHTEQQQAANSVNLGVSLEGSYSQRQLTLWTWGSA